MKEVRIEWLHHGCPRHGNLFTRLNKAKRLFRNVHRKTVELYFVRLYNEIDKAAEINQSQFWISEGDNYIHLGVTCNKYSKLGTVIDGACRSLRGNLMALINIKFRYVLHFLYIILSLVSRPLDSASLAAN